MQTKLSGEQGFKVSALVFDTGEKFTAGLTRFAADHGIHGASLIEDLGLRDGKPAFHAHMVVGTKGGVAHAGQVLEAWVRPTLEVIVTETPSYLVREYASASHRRLLNRSR